MNLRSFFRAACCAIGAALLSAGCATNKPYDYTNYRAHLPHSILVLPPLNESTAVVGTYGYLSTVTEPLAEKGYYVFPVEVVDQFFKANGMPTAGEMQQVSLAKVSEITGADAVLFLTLKQYGSKYEVITSATIVHAKGRLVDTKTGTVLWEGEVTAEEKSGGSNLVAALVAAAVTQVINSSLDEAHAVSRIANAQLFDTKNHGLLLGPRNPKFGSDK